MGRPKSELTWRGRRWIVHVVEAARDGGCASIVVVSGAHPIVGIDDVRLVENSGWRLGQLSSLQVGLRALADEATAPTGVVVLTVDRPHLRGDTVATLLRAHAGAPDMIWQPSLGSQHGHPILYPWALALALLELPPTASARELLHRPAVQSRRRTVPVDDPAVLANLDTPDAARQLPD